MASFTENYNLIKPGQEDIYNIGDFNDNVDIIDAELKDRVLRSGDISNTQITAFDTITEEFPVPAAGEATRTFAGKIRKFIQDFNNFKTGILTVGMLVNNAVTNNSQLPVSAAVAKVLQDQVTQLNSDITASDALIKLKTIGIQYGSLTVERAANGTTSTVFDFSDIFSRLLTMICNARTSFPGSVNASPLTSGASATIYLHNGTTATGELVVYYIAVGLLK